MLSLCELRRAARVIEAEFSGHRLERAVQPDGEQLALALYGRERASGRSRKRFLLLSCRRDLARIGEIEALPAAPERPPAFASWLRAHAVGARLTGAEVVGGDRQLALAFEAGEAGQARFELLLSLLGGRSNVYVLGAERQLVAALRPLADTRSELALGAPWQSPAGGAPTEGEDRWAQVPDAEWLAAVAAHYAVLESERGTSDLARQLRQALARESKSARRRLERIEAELAEADETGALQRHGELLKTALSRIQPGDTEVCVTDFETGAEVRVPLDPAKSPKQNLEATFKRYQKLLRRLSKAGAQMDEARRACDAIAAFEAELSVLGSAAGPEHEEALRAFAARPELGRLLGRLPGSQGPGAGKAASRAGSEPEGPQLPARLRGLPRKLLPRRYRSLDGLEIWVGRSDEANDYLTTRLARGNDLFFHLDGAPGSHVILRTEGREDPPHESLLDACELAVHFSKQKKAGRADVHVVPIKQVKKPKGAKPGLVWVTGGRSLHLRREEKRLQRLLESRLDE